VKKPWKHEQAVHERLRREAEAEGLLASGTVEDEVVRPPEPLPVGATFGGSSADQGVLAFAGIPRTRGDWDVVITGEAPGLAGADELGFVVVEDGDIYMDSYLPEGDVTPLAEVIEQQLQPPYRAYGVRREGDLWAVSARGIELARFHALGDEIELTVRGGEQELVVDGRKSHASAPELEQLGKEAGDDFFVSAERIEDELWEITLSPL
jgi:hypothetical protein